MKRTEQSTIRILADESGVKAVSVSAATKHDQLRLCGRILPAVQAINTALAENENSGDDAK
jgi:hypothetical protein